MRGIIFDAESIRGIKDGNKVMTRRVAKKVPEIRSSFHRIVYDRHPFFPSAFVGTPGEGKIQGQDRYAWIGEDAWGNGIGVEELNWLKCPYGLPGDIIRVKERWATSVYLDGKPPKDAVGHGVPFWYEEDDSVLYIGAVGGGPSFTNKGKWRTPLYMPECATRIWLKIEEVRLEPLQRITWQDAVKEGDKERSGMPEFFEYGPDCHVRWYRRRWDEINQKRGFGWDTNPMVWVIGFSVHKILETRTEQDLIHYDCIVCHECGASMRAKEFHVHDCKQNKLNRVQKRISEIMNDQNRAIEQHGELSYLLMEEKRLKGEPLECPGFSVEETEDNGEDGYTRLFKALIGKRNHVK